MKTGSLCGMMALAFVAGASLSNAQVQVSLAPIDSNLPILVGSNIVLSATATTTGTVTGVAFYFSNTIATNFIGSVLAAPYELTWASVPLGQFNVTAVATNDSGLTGSANLVVTTTSEFAGLADYSAPAGFQSVVSRSAAAGFLDGVGTSARFNNPTAIVFDSSNNAYISDGLNNAIRKISADGTVSTLAGGQLGSTDGVGTNASFNFPSGLALSPDGNLYVADQMNHCIRRVGMDGTVTTIAGTAGKLGTNDGAGLAALFNHPAGIAVDPGGNLYVADMVNATIRLIDVNTNVTTISGTPSPQLVGASIYAEPQALVVDASTNIYVADTRHGAIRKIAPGGIVSLIAKGFILPAGLAFDGQGNLLVSDLGNQTISAVATNGSVTLLVGQPVRGDVDGAGSQARFNRPLGIAMDGNGNILVADSLNHAIRRIDNNYVVSTWAGSSSGPGVAGPASVARFNYPISLLVDASDNLYVADLLNSVIRKISPFGAFTTIGQPGITGNVDGPGSNALFSGPIGLASDNAGNIYVADADENTIRRIDSSGNVTTLAGRAGVAGSVPVSASVSGTNALFNAPHGLAVDSSGNLFVADTSNQVIRLITPDGMVSTWAGKYGVTGYTNAVGTNAVFFNPTGLAIDSSNNLYVADSGNRVVRMIAPDQTVSWYAGTPKVAGSADGPVATATFSDFSWLTLDPAGNVYLADYYNHTIRMVSTNGQVVTLGGFPGQPGFADGAGELSRFDGPNGVAVDANGILYVADSLNNAIRMGVLPNAPVPSLDFSSGDGTFALSFPNSSTNVHLEGSATLGPGAQWITIPNTVLSGGRMISSNSVSGGSQFFRLRSP